MTKSEKLIKKNVTCKTILDSNKVWQSYSYPLNTMNFSKFHFQHLGHSSSPLEAPRTQVLHSLAVHKNDVTLVLFCLSCHLKKSIFIQLLCDKTQCYSKRYFDRFTHFQFIKENLSPCKRSEKEAKVCDIDLFKET